MPRRCAVPTLRYHATLLYFSLGKRGCRSKRALYTDIHGNVQAPLLGLRPPLCGAARRPPNSTMCIYVHNKDTGLCTEQANVKMYCSQRRREIENIFSPAGLPPHVPAVRVPAVQFTFGHLDLQWSAAKCAAIQRVKGVARELRGTVHKESLALVRLLPIMFRNVRQVHCR